MRETYRSDDNKTYWTKRWENIGVMKKWKIKILSTEIHARSHISQR